MSTLGNIENHRETDVTVQSGIVEVELSQESRRSILNVSAGMSSAIYGSLEDRGYALPVAQEASTILSYSRPKSALNDLREGRTVAVRITGLPIDPAVCAPPTDGGTPYGKRTYVSETVGLAIAFALGEPTLLLGEKKEALIHQITPVPGREETQSNEGQVDLRFHQDLAAHPDFREMPYDRFMPDWLVLTGVRSGSDTTKTYVAVLDEAVLQVGERSFEILHDKRFVTDPPDSFVKEQGGEKPDYLPTHPILSDREGFLESAFDLSSNVRPVDAEDVEGKSAIDELEEAFMTVRREVIIEPGTALAFNNRRIVHGRSSVAVESLANRRWIQRVYVCDMVRTMASSGFLPIMLGGGLIGVSGTLESDRRLLSL